jgi:hypothetical protein
MHLLPELLYQRLLTQLRDLHREQPQILLLTQPVHVVTLPLKLPPFNPRVLPQLLFNDRLRPQLVLILHPFPQSLGLPLSNLLLPGVRQKRRGQ